MTELTTIKNFFCGIEIECETSKRFTYDSYHSSQRGETSRLYNGWCCERDGSLYTQQYSNTYEFVLPTPIKVSDYETVLKEFKTLFSKSKPFSDIGFNRSMGAHIHISLPSKTEPSLFLNDSFIRKFRENLFAEVKQVFTNNLTGETDFTDWLLHYHRSYAKKRSKWTQDKYSEVRISPYNTLEFRGMHLLGVTSWSMFFDMYGAFFKALDKSIASYVKKGKLKRHRIPVRRLKPKVSGSLQSINKEMEKPKEIIESCSEIFVGNMDRFNKVLKELI